MYWMIKDLLNYDFSKDKKNKMITNLLMLGMGKLEQNYNMPKGQTVGFLDGKVGANLRACANQETGEIKFNSNFLQDPEKYGRDMMTVFHELRHIAQYHGKKNEKAQTRKLDLTYANHPDLVTMLVCSELCKPNENIGEAWRYDSTVCSLFYSRWNQYLFAKYFYSPCERDARMFGRKFLSSIMDSVKNEKLNDIEKNNFNLIQKSIDEDTKKEDEQLKKFDETIKNEEKDFIKVNKQAQDKYIDMIDRCTYMKNPDSYINYCGFNCFEAMFSSLCFVYNEKHAQTFFDSCLKMKCKDNTYLSFAINFIKYSDFTPNKQQFELLCNKCQEFNNNCSDKSQYLDPKITFEKMKTNQSQESMTQSLGVL